MERICYMNPVLGAPYGTFGGLVDGIDYYSQTASGYNLMHRAPYNPMEDAYRIALRSLEDSFEREIMTLNRFYPMDYSERGGYYHLESEARYRYEKAKNRLYDDFRNAAQRYAYDYDNRRYAYGLRQNRLHQYSGWDWDFDQSYTYIHQYINSKETTPVPTETKKWIIISSEGPNDNPKTHTTLADAEKEAQRLARKFPAQEFTIYETKKAYKIAEKPVDVKVFV